MKSNYSFIFHIYLNIHEVFTVECSRILPGLFFFSVFIILYNILQQQQWVECPTKRNQPSLGSDYTSQHALQGYGLDHFSSHWTDRNLTESDTKEKSQGVCRSGREGAGQKRRHGLLHGGHDKARSIIVSVKDGGHTSNGIFSPWQDTLLTQSK